MTTKDDIKDWFKTGKKRKATHMVIICDSFSYEDYPVYVFKGTKVGKVVMEYSTKEMQRVMEVYDLKKDMKKQLEEERAFNY